MSLFCGNIVDPIKKKIFPGTIEVNNGRIVSITEEEGKSYDNYLLPGFVDSHIHVESSMLTPSEFGRLLVRFGTVATVSDCHEIANVAGIEGVKYMLRESQKTPLKIFFGIPSCVPATDFDSSGAVLDADALEELMKMDELKYLGEFMDFPGVINMTPKVKAKLDMARKYGKLVDGHAPELRGADAKKYIDAGISTDHECVTIDEALEKIDYGMKVQMRQGVAVKNFDDLIPIGHDNFENCMFCSDDVHPDILLRGHMNLLVQKAVRRGIGFFKVLQMVSVNPVKHYGLDVGLMQVGDSADFIEMEDLQYFDVMRTVIAGEVVFEKGKEILQYNEPEIINNFVVECPENLDVPHRDGEINVIELVKDQVLTKRTKVLPKVEEGKLVCDLDRDLLKIVNLNRYKGKATPTIAFVKGFGLKRGAIASSVAHDSHNILAVGTNDADILRAMEMIIENKGGIVFVDGDTEFILPLPVGGIMSDLPYLQVAKSYKKLEELSCEAGSSLFSSYMSLSFLTLLVIPEIKISDRGLFDSVNFRFLDLYAD